MVLHLPVKYPEKYISSHETGRSRFRIALYDPVNVSPAMAVAIDAYRGKAEFKIHISIWDKSEPPADSAIILPSRHSAKYFIYYSTTW